MKTWHISVEDGPHQSYDIEVQAPTKEVAIDKALKQELKKFPHKPIAIYPAACWEIKKPVSGTSRVLNEAPSMSEDERGVVNILCYRGTIYDVYERYEDAYAAAKKQFGEGAMIFLDVNIIRKRVK